MAGIGRPRGRKGHNPVQAEAMRQFTVWRNVDLPMVISAEKAYEISEGMVDVRDERPTISLSAVALSLAIARRKK